MSRHLYLVHVGDQHKIGTTYDLVRRLNEHANAARRDGLTFTPLFSLPAHVESESNERAVLAEFGTRGSRSEYFVADPDDVIGFIQGLPCTVVPAPERVRQSEQWLDRAQVAQTLRVSLQTVDRYVHSGHLPSYKNSITKRVRFRIEDVREFAGVSTP